MDDIITLDYGSGGKKTAALIDEIIVPELGNAVLNSLGDGAVLEGGLAFSTDSFVVSPLFFPGGDIGKLSVCGTVNDLAMCGAEPKYLSLALIIEEGLPAENLRRVVASIKSAAEAAGVQIVTGGHQGRRARQGRRALYKHRGHRPCEIPRPRPG
ncbi:MAG: AIR synthase related protein [Lachnospiraceae bacterium]